LHQSGKLQEDDELMTKIKADDEVNALKSIDIKEIDIEDG
jgi:hypothetical protein